MDFLSYPIFLLLGIHDTSTTYKVSTKDENFVCIWDACLKCLCQILDPFLKFNMLAIYNKRQKIAMESVCCHLLIQNIINQGDSHEHAYQ